MNTCNLKARSATWRPIFICVSLLGIIAVGLLLRFDNGSERIGSAGLIIGNGCPPGSPNQRQEAVTWNSKKAIYVLGGTQDSLELKYRAAAVVYKKDETEKLMVASSGGVTEYSQKLERNLTNDEWTINQLTGDGVRCEDIVFIKLQDGFFGTLREAETLREIVPRKSIKKLVLVCSAYHCKRVRYTFSIILENTGVQIHIRPVDEQVGGIVLVVEHLKLIFYHILIPLHRYFVKCLAAAFQPQGSLLLCPSIRTESGQFPIG